MTESHTHTPSFAAILGWLSLLGAIAGGAYFVTESVERNINLLRSELSQKSDAIITAIAAMPTSSATTTDNTAVLEAIDALKNDLATTRDQLTSLEARATATQTPNNAGLVRALERQVWRGEPFAVELDRVAELPAAKAYEAVIAELRAFAVTGVPSELALRAQLDATINAATQPSTTSTNEKRLGGLVSIKRRENDAPDPYAPLRALRADSSLAQIEVTVQSLPETARAPLASWLTLVAKRTKALQSLDTLGAALL